MIPAQRFTACTLLGKRVSLASPKIRFVSETSSSLIESADLIRSITFISSGEQCPSTLAMLCAA